MTRSSRAGTSVIEVLVALLVGLLLARAGWAMLAGQRRAAESVVLGAEAQEVGRTVRRILVGELRSGTQGTDWRVHGRDSLTLRAFRGTGWICGVAPGLARSWTVAYRGLRAPSPVKDSVLVLTAAGVWRRGAISDVEGAGPACHPIPRATGYRITVDREVSGAVLLRVFERGSYHLTGHALRYRVGLGGRQPLTPERLASGSRLEGRADGVLLLLDYRWVAGLSRPLPEWWTLRSLAR